MLQVTENTNSSAIPEQWRAVMTQRIIFFLCMVYIPQNLYLIFTASSAAWVPALMIYGCLVVLDVAVPKGSKLQIYGLVMRLFLLV
ncbi:MAG: hypothetical protein ACJAVI_003692 [Candidatus Azotimanducaceae bacterium]